MQGMLDVSDKTAKQARGAQSMATADIDDPKVRGITLRLRHPEINKVSGLCPPEIHHICNVRSSPTGRERGSLGVPLRGASMETIP